MDILENDYDLLMDVIHHDPTCISYASVKMRDNFNIIFEAVERDGTCLQYASKRLKNNYSICLTAIKQNNFAIMFCGKKILSNITFIKEILNFCPFLFVDRFATEKIRNNKEYALKVASIKPLEINFLKLKHRKDIDVCVEAVKSNELSFVFIKIKCNSVEELFKKQFESILTEKIKDKKYGI